MKFKAFTLVIGVSVLSLPFLGCSKPTGDSSRPALFETKLEAEQAAKVFGCTGAHKMGKMWMPCSQHGAHEHHNDNKGMKH